MNPRDHFLMLARCHVWATDRLLDHHVAPEIDLLFVVLADQAKKAP